MVGIQILFLLIFAALIAFAVRQRLVRKRDAPTMSPEDIKLQAIITTGVRRGVLEAIGLYLAVSALIAFLIWVLNVSYQFG